MIPTFVRHAKREILDNRDLMYWVWRELMSSRAKRSAIFFMLAMAGMMGIYMTQPIVFAEVVNGLERNTKLQVMAAVVGMAVLLFARSGVDLVARLIREYVGNRNMLELYDRANALFYEKSLGQHLEESSQLNYANVDKACKRTEQVQELILLDAAVHVPALIIAYGLLWSFGWMIGLLATAVITVHGLWSLYLNYRCSVDLEQVEHDFRHHHRQLVERWEKIARVKTSGKTRSERNRLRQEFHDVLERDKRFWYWFNRQDTYRELIVMVLRIAMIGYGAYLVYAHDHSVGYLIPLYTWVREVGGSLMNLSRIERQLSEHMPYLRTLRDVLTMPAPFRQDTGVPITDNHRISMRFENVSLSFGDVTVLDNVSLNVGVGEKVALIGPSGAGKSSMMKLALRFMDPDTGEIWVNGNRLRDIELISWMQRVGYIPQQPEILDGTIRYNLTFGLTQERKACITDEEIWEVMRQLRIDFPGRLTHGLDTRVGRNGVKLSGGQAQRLMIGAAVIKQPHFMIIDEATSSLDSSTERAVQDGLRRALTDDIGALIIAHRLSTVQDMCDKFVVLQSATEVADGESQIEAVASSFEELYAVSPTFCRLADDQGVLV